MDDFKLKFQSIYLNLKKNTIPIQYGIIAALITILTVNYLLNLNFILIGIYRLIEFTLLISIVFIIYSWLTILYGKFLNEQTIFIIFSTCLIIEFLTQFFDYNLTNNNSNNVGDKELENNFLSNNLNYILIILLNILTSIYLNVNFVKTFIITFLLILTRFYAQFFYSNYLPQILIVYFIYFCAFSGILFTKYLESQLINNDTSMSNLLFGNSNKIKYSNCNGNTMILSSSSLSSKKLDKEEEREENNNLNLKSNSTKNIVSSTYNNNAQVNKYLNSNSYKMNNSNLKQRRKLSVSSLPSMIPKRRISLPIITVKTDKVILY